MVAFSPTTLLRVSPVVRPLFFNGLVKEHRDGLRGERADFKDGPIGVNHARIACAMAASTLE